MSWTLKRKAQQLLAGEEGAIRKDWGGRTSVALVYPNTYAVGMSNLGFQAIYSISTPSPRWSATRVFFPVRRLDESFARRRRRSRWSRSGPDRTVDITGFSVTYEGDYINLVRMLRLAAFRREPPTAGPSIR